MRSRSVLVLALLAYGLPARALECFVPASNASALATGPASARSSAMPVTLATTFRTVAGCDYGLTADPRHMGAIAPAETDFIALSELLHAPPGSRPRTLYGRPRREGAAVESVYREGCTDTLLDDQSFFDTSVDTATRHVVVTRATPPAPRPPFAAGAPRVAAPDCGASRTVLRFVPLDHERDAPPVVSREPAPYVLDASARRVVLDVSPPGGFAVYASRPSPRNDAPGLLVGRIQHLDPHTALRRVFNGAGEAPWFRPTWNAQGDFLFARARGLQDADAWNELVTAAQADALWLADAPEELSPREAPRVHGRVSIAASGDGVVMPPGYVTRAMTERYGREARVLVPTLDEWDALRRRLQLCVIDRYASAHAPPPERVPASASCAPLARVASAVSIVPPNVTTPVRREVCVRRNTWDLTAAGVVRTGELPETCIPLPATASRAATPATALTRLIASVGDRIALRGPDEYNLFACVDNHCRILHEAGEGGRGARLWRPGYVEVRRAPSLEAAIGAEGVTLARFVVIDPARDWHPVGLYMGRPIPEAQDPRDAPDDDANDPRGPQDRGGAWRTLDHDEPEVFAYVRRRQTLQFRVAFSPAAAAVWNSPDAPTVLTSALPIAGALRGTAPSPHDPALVVLLTRDGRCPAERASAVQARVPIDPDAMLVDQTFYAHLARSRGDEPFECVARAAFRVRQRRVISPIPNVQMGLLGDTTLTWFYNDPMAIGVAVPVVYAYARLPYGFGVDGSVSLTAAVTFESADLSRAGAGVSVAAVWGPVRHAPRILSVGLMAHLATETASISPTVSPYVGLNLATLIDLAGGR